MTAFVDANIVASLTTPSSVELFTPFIPTAYPDAVTIKTVTTPLNLEDYIHPTGMWGIYDTDSGHI
jgi:hypothetical protein